MKKLIILSFIMLSLKGITQEKVSIGFYQDAALASKEDNHLNKPFTTGIIKRVIMQGNQQAFGYMIVYPEFEYAELKVKYTRYSANLGYTFNKSIFDKIESSLSGGYGIINREGSSYGSSSLNGSLSYKIGRSKIIALAQVVDRKDIYVVRWSGFLGIEISLQ